jgi:hypothetical protein
MYRYSESKKRHGINETPKWMQRTAAIVIILAAIAIISTLFSGYNQYSNCVDNGGRYVPQSYNAIIFMDDDRYDVEPLNGNAVCVYRRDDR